MNRLTLALDIMGGDFGPRVTIPATIKALESDPLLNVLLFGDSVQITSMLENVSTTVRDRITLHHCNRVITNNLGLTSALRQSQGSSMRCAIEAVRNGKASGCVSAGDTAVLMGLAKIILRAIPNIQRPALVSVLPTMNAKQSIMLDLGANLDCSAQTLTQFAQMGAIFAENKLKLLYPKIALLNVGTEELKGVQYIRDAAQLIKKNTQLNYIGYIEGNVLLNGIADVIVCDGFAGNIALKTLEGSAKNLLSLFKNSNRPPSMIKKALLYLGKRLFIQFLPQFRQFDPDRYNGASLLGLTSVVVKSHGGANQNAFFHAIEEAKWQVRSNIPYQIQQGLTT